MCKNGGFAPGAPSGGGRDRLRAEREPLRPDRAPPHPAGEPIRAGRAGLRPERERLRCDDERLRPAPDLLGRTHELLRPRTGPAQGRSRTLQCRTRAPPPGREPCGPDGGRSDLRASSSEPSVLRASSIGVLSVSPVSPSEDTLIDSHEDTHRSLPTIIRADMNALPTRSSAG